MNTLVPQETLKAAFHALAESMWSSLRSGYLNTAESHAENLAVLAAAIDDDWYAGRAPIYRETVQEAREVERS